MSGGVQGWTQVVEYLKAEGTESGSLSSDQGGTRTEPGNVGRNQVVVEELLSAVTWALGHLRRPGAGHDLSHAGSHRRCSRLQVWSKQALARAIHAGSEDCFSLGPGRSESGLLFRGAGVDLEQPDSRGFLGSSSAQGPQASWQVTGPTR